MKIKIATLMIITVALFSNGIFAQLVPNSTNPESLQLRLNHGEEYDPVYRYFEWEVASSGYGSQQFFLNTWWVDGSVQYEHTVLTFNVTNYPAAWQQTMKFDGKIEAEEIEVKNLSLPDYVFANDYSLKSLSEVELFIKANSHLPGVPSAAEVAENGMNMTQMTNAMLMKIEELTLYMIELKKENTELKRQVNQLLE